MRPTKPCARCIRDTLPDCEHLGAMYDKAQLKGLSDQDLIEYALNRMWALERDNTSKAAGNKASRVYKSRNLATSTAIEGRCPVYKGPLKCMRNTNHPTNDRDDHGSHKF